MGQGKPPTTTPEQRRESAERRGNLLFLPALIIPAVVGVFGALVLLWTIVIYTVMHGVSGLYSAAGATSGSAMQLQDASRAGNSIYANII